MLWANTITTYFTLYFFSVDRFDFLGRKLLEASSFTQHNRIDRACLQALNACNIYINLA